MKPEYLIVPETHIAREDFVRLALSESPILSLRSNLPARTQHPPSVAQFVIPGLKIKKRNPVSRNICNFEPCVPFSHGKIPIPAHRESSVLGMCWEMQDAESGWHFWDRAFPSHQRVQDEPKPQHLTWLDTPVCKKISFFSSSYLEDAGHNCSLKALPEDSDYFL